MSDPVEITCLGTGSAFCYDNWQSNFFINKVGESRGMLVDCGGDCRHACRDAHIDLTDISAVYISHPHADHVGGLEWLAFASYFRPGLPRPKMFIHEKWVDALWENSLKGGLASLEGDVATLDTYFDVKAVPANTSFVFDGIEFEMVQTIHVMDGNEIVPSFGLMFEVNGYNVFLTTDTQFAPNQISKFYDRADTILHDCETGFKSGVHAHYSQLRELPAETKAKMWLYHYQDGPLPDAVADGFKGFLKKGQVLRFWSKNVAETTHEIVG